MELSAHPEADAEAERLANCEARAPFSLTQESLARVDLFRTAAEKHLLVVNIHHLVADGWSIGVFMRDLAHFYKMHTIGHTPPLPKLPIQYGDFALWQRELPQSSRWRENMDYWVRQLRGAPPLLALPADHMRPAAETHRGASLFFTWPEALTAKLKEMSRKEGATVYQVLLAARNILLQRYTLQDDVVVGSPFSGRDDLETEDLIGFFVNTHALRTNLTGDPTFDELLNRLREVTLGATPRQQPPLHHIVRALEADRTIAAHSLFQVAFGLQRDFTEGWSLPGAAATHVDLDNSGSKFDLTVLATEGSREIRLRFEYSTDLFDTATVRRWARQFRVLVEGIVAERRRRISEYSLDTAEERRQWLPRGIGLITEYERDYCVHEIFGQVRLIDYFVASGKRPPKSNQLRGFLAQHLPEFMVPSAFVPIETLPLTPNGKVDRTALPEPEKKRPSLEKKYASPRDAIELELTRIWENVLGVEPIGIEDHFFDLGGHSFLAMRLAARIEKTFGKKLRLATIFMAPTIEKLAAVLRDEMQEGSVTAGTSLVELQAKGTKPPLFFVHGAGGGMFWGYVNLARRLGQDQPVYGLSSRGLDRRPEFGTIEEMAAQYIRDLRIIQPRGPYHLGGYCFGGNVAYEMARQLVAAGEQVALLALLDSAPANAGYETVQWWRPEFFYRFSCNLYYWLRDFRAVEPRDRRRFMARKLRTFGRKVIRWAKGAAEGDTVDLEEVIDPAQFATVLGLAGADCRDDLHLARFGPPRGNSGPGLDEFWLQQSHSCRRNRATHYFRRRGRLRRGKV